MWRSLWEKTRNEKTGELVVSRTEVIEFPGIGVVLKETTLLKQPSKQNAVNVALQPLPGMRVDWKHHILVPLPPKGFEDTEEDIDEGMIEEEIAIDEPVDEPDMVVEEGVIDEPEGTKNPRKTRRQPVKKGKPE